MGYGNERASDHNINFAFDTALAAARQCWELAGHLRAHHAALATDAGELTSWIGPKKIQFDDKLGVIRTDSDTLAAALEALAHEFAQMWARARGQQDRINRARWIQREVDDDNFLENAWEHFAGENDYGPPPDDPDTPTPPLFEPTRAPLHSEYAQM